MKKIKVFLAILLVAALNCPRPVVALAQQNESYSMVKLLRERIHKIQNSVFSEEEMAKTLEVSSQYQKLLQNICEGEQYPNYYGGAYRADDGELVVLLTTESNKIITEIKKITGNDKVIVKRVSIPLNVLKKMQDAYAEKWKEYFKQKDNLNIFSEEEKGLIEDFKGLYISQANNKLVIKIKDLSEEKVAIFKKLFGNESGVVFENAGEVMDAATEWRPGRRIYAPVYDLSTGYRAYYTDASGRHAGFVTAAHGCNVEDSVYIDSNRTNKLGVCRKSIHSGNVDVAFVEITKDNCEASNTLFYTNNSGATTGTLTTLATTTYATNILERDMMFKVGASTFLTVGNVTSTDEYMFTIYGTIENLVHCTMNIDSGDSGGCAFVASGSQFVAAGTVKAKDTQKGGGYVSQIKYEIPALGVIKY